MISKVFSSKKSILNVVNSISYYVPILLDKVLGVIQIQKKQLETFSPVESKVLDILGRIGGVYVVYLDNEEIIQEEVKNLMSEIQLYQKSLRHLSSEMDILKLTKRIMIEARELVNAERCNMFLIDKESNTLWSPIPHVCLQ